ncbi:Pentatricopeptide repeat-containing protein [Arachis hypogaea]|nr:Pentatricopeptide repeat-containing protein [Arachis hypogaea]
MYHPSSLVFTWNPAIVSNLVALLDQLGHSEEAEALVFGATSKFESRNKELTLFYLCGLCAMDRPCEVKDLVEDLRGNGGGIDPLAFELKSIMYGYGRLGLFHDLQRVVDQMKRGGFEIDTVCTNMVLSTFSTHGEHMEIVSWLKKMRSSGISFSVRTYNSISNSCPIITRMMAGLNELPLLIEELNVRLEGGEAIVVKELLDSCVILEEVMVWDSSEAKLDLHGCHLGSSYLIMLLWLKEMRRRRRKVEKKKESDF